MKLIKVFSCCFILVAAVSFFDGNSKVNANVDDYVMFDEYGKLSSKSVSEKSAKRTIVNSPAIYRGVKRINLFKSRQGRQKISRLVENICRPWRDLHHWRQCSPR